VKTLPAFETKQTNNQSRRSKRRLPLRTYKAGSFSTASGFSNRVARRELRSLLCVKITVETTPSRRAERTNKGYKTKSHPLGEVLECNQSNQPSETRDRSFPPNRDRGVRRDANHAVRKARLCVTKKLPRRPYPRRSRATHGSARRTRVRPIPVRSHHAGNRRRRVPARVSTNAAVRASRRVESRTNERTNEQKITRNRRGSSSDERRSRFRARSSLRNRGIARARSVPSRSVPSRTVSKSFTLRTPIPYHKSLSHHYRYGHASRIVKDFYTTEHSLEPRIASATPTTCPCMRKQSN
jgi:hypothetical protein